MGVNTMQTRRKRQLLWAMLAGAVTLAAYGWCIVCNRLKESPPGYCAAQQRYISDEEFIQTAIAMFERDMDRERREHQSGKISKRKDDQPELYQKWQSSLGSPECCRVYRGYTESVVNRLLGSQEVEVDLVIDQKNAGDSTLPFSFSVCGELLPHEFGFQPPSNVAVTTRNYQGFIHTK
jgi:hypothetical protein